ncbi:TetR family transcriptional regulator [Conexibacter sp. JD483]|uniref:TetR/AcrR family transcriptional regulator n=1 Tax=unclassified Conexibacter TaxID=2627773 RepID=UPI002728D15D|nr:MULTISPECIES: TetR/AcrR family transcriptional regulator [unclassified Conexibacter]MDO8186031.1 TetR family transcriptional regulator [Conexibacter sp. CPCC 205706]MDO8199521.1 TetR family transcriptional regulator [Conexibacter sp. CPCC 205762]MDR9368944.1 TetR family transcriptional regulator [Conexibacter sp. JD483]
METVGRRERKKAQTRQALSDAATRLFRERGFDAVTVAQVAEEADVSLATLFKHFPDGKESLVFSSGEEDGRSVPELVRERPAGVTVLDGLEAVMRERGPFELEPSPWVAQRIELIMATPALRDHARRRWLASADPIAALLAAEAGRDAPAVEDRALARYALEIPDVAGDAPDPRAALESLFARLRRGWAGA